MYIELINKDKFVEFKKLGNTYFLMCEPEEVVEGLLNVKIATVHLNKKMTYDEVVSKFIHARYTSDNEIALINNALDNVSELASNEEYKEYMRWRELAKDAASDYLGLEVDPLAKAKKVKLREIEEYDSSSEVNGFHFGGQLMWLDKATRVGLMNSTQIQKAAGLDSTTLWFGGHSITLAIDSALQMLAAIEMYALECYNVTAHHKANVEALESIEAIEAYDITEGYPEKLNLSI